MSQAKKPGVMLYFELYPLLREMTVEDVHALIMAIFEYAQNGVVPELPNAALRYVWALVKINIDRDNERYYRVVESRQRAAVQSHRKKDTEIDDSLDAYI